MFINVFVNNLQFVCLPVSLTTDSMLLWFTAVGFFTTDLLTYFAPFVSMEQIDGFYHVQMMSSMSPFAYWLATFIFDFVFYFISMVIRIIVFKYVSGSDFIGFHEAFCTFYINCYICDQFIRFAFSPDNLGVRVDKIEIEDFFSKMFLRCFFTK